MTFQEIEYFLTLCEERSFSAAAAKLFITQQGLSKAIKKLEQDLSFPLFQRSRQGLILTHNGEELFRIALECRTLQVRLNACIDNLRDANQCIRVGVIMGALLAIPPNIVEELRALLAPSRVEITETTDIDCEDYVERGLFDFGITLAPVDHQRFSEQTLYHRPMYAVINCKHPLASCGRISFEDLRDQRFILANRRFRSYFNFIDCCRAHGFSPDIADTTMDMTFIYTKVLQENWIGISADMANSPLLYPGVVLVPFPEEDFRWQLILISKANRSFNQAERAFSHHLRQLFARI